MGVGLKEKSLEPMTTAFDLELEAVFCKSWVVIQPQPP
jgi:hypothetical protein